MDLSINQRLIEYCEYYNIKQVDLVEKINIGKDQISKWFNKINQVSVAGLSAIVRNYKIDAKWLLTGEGDMIIENKGSYTPEKIPQLLAQDSPTSPFEYDCGHERCQIEKRHLLKDISRLEQHLDDMRRKETGCCPGEIEGGVEAPGKTG